MLSNKFLISFGLILCLNLQGLSNKDADIFSKINSGVVASAYLCSKLNDDDINFKLGITTALVAGITYLTSQLVFSNYTPFSYVNHAKRVIKENEQIFILVKQNIEHDKTEFIETIKKLYVSEKFPILTAFNKLSKLHKDVQNLVKNLKQAQSDNQETGLAKDISALLVELEQEFLEKLVKAMLVVKSDPMLMVESQLYAVEKNTETLSKLQLDIALSNFNRLSFPRY